MENPPANPSSFACSITHLGNDLLQSILAKLPAQSFASAACVSRGWNDVCSSILSRPVLASAISTNPSFHEAMKEVIGQVFAAPIRPHFAILCICPTFNMDEAHHLIAEKLGSTIPIVTCDSAGIIGRDALSGNFSEVKFSDLEEDVLEDSAGIAGISLTVGYIPGLKVDAIPLFGPEKGVMINKFVMDIRDYTASVSGCTAPEAIFMFGDSGADMMPVLDKLDYGLSEQTVIAGNERCHFRYQSITSSRKTATHHSKHGELCGAVALVFASDRTVLNRPAKIHFHFAMGAGVTAVGPTYKVVSARVRSQTFATWLTARREGENETLDGDQMLADLDMEMGDPLINYDLYIGVMKRRKISIDSEKVKPVTSLVYHTVQDEDEQYLYVGGLDIRTGDSFRFYVPDSRLALRLSDTLSENFGRLRHTEVLGGFVFACCGRGATFFNKPNVDSSPLKDNFPGIPLSGMFCGGEIGRGTSSVAESDAEGNQADKHSCLHVYSSIYVLMCCG